MPIDLNNDNVTSRALQEVGHGAVDIMSTPTVTERKMNLLATAKTHKTKAYIYRH